MLLAHDPSLLSEAQWSGVVRDVARATGYTLRYHTFSSKRSTHGFPDWVFCRPRDGRLIFAELKTEGGKVSNDQLLWLEGLRACGVEAYVWRPSQYDEIASVLSRRPARAA